eukprot:5224263-Prymnesium_polylepis.1
MACADPQMACADPHMACADPQMACADSQRACADSHTAIWHVLTLRWHAWLVQAFAPPKQQRSSEELATSGHERCSSVASHASHSSKRLPEVRMRRRRRHSCGRDVA